MGESYAGAPSETHLNRIQLPDDYRRIHEALDLPDIEKPLAVLGLAQSVQPELMRRMGTPAIATVVRDCGRRQHADGVRTPAPSHAYREIAGRFVFVPPNAGRIAVRRSLLELDMQGTGHTRATDENGWTRKKIVAAPITPSEQMGFFDHDRFTLVAASPSTQYGRVDVYAVLHPDANGDPLERVVELDEEYREL
jgi:hypothetical protein